MHFELSPEQLSSDMQSLSAAMAFTFSRSVTARQNLREPLLRLHICTPERLPALIVSWTET